MNEQRPKLKPISIALAVVVYAVLSISLFLSSSALAKEKQGLQERKLNSKAEGTLYLNSYALLIANAEYQSPTWNSLPGIEQDIPAVRRALLAHNFKVDEAWNLTRNELLARIDEFISDYGQNYENRLLIYYAGHGYTASLSDGRKMGYLVMKDAPNMPPVEEALKKPPVELAKLRLRAISMDEINEKAQAIATRHALFVFDSCFSGTVLYRDKVVSKPPEITSEELEQMRGFLTAGNERQRVLDDSVFRREFVKGLEGAADLNNDGLILFTELGLHLRSEVAKGTQNRQTPIFGKSEAFKRGEMVFVLPKGQASLPRLLKAITENPAKITKPEDSSGKPATKLDIVTAQSMLDRAIQTRDGSMQGQIEALEFLLALGHEFSNTDLSGLTFRGANVSKGIFKRASMHMSDLSGADAGNSSFEESGWRFTNVEKAKFNSATLNRMYAPFVRGKDAVFEGADLSESNFYSGDFRGANFRNANLRGTSFSFADLRGAKFDGADLTGTFFVGAVLDDATFVGATFHNTDFTAAVSSNLSLGPTQKDKVCRRLIIDSRWVPIVYVSTDTRRGERQGDDVMFESLNKLYDASLPLCTTPPTIRKENSYIGYRNGIETITLHSSFASKGRRIELINDRLKEHLLFLTTNLVPNRVIKGDNAQRIGWDAFMRNAVKNAKPISKPYLNADLMLVFLVSKKFIDIKQLDWEQFARFRYNLEANINKSYGNNVNGHSMWPRLFPPNAPWMDLPTDRVELFKAWTLARIGIAPKVVTITRRLNHAAWDDSDGKSKNVLLSNQELIDTADGYSLHDSSSSSGIPFKSLQIEDGRVTSTPNVSLMSTAFVWPDDFDDYYLKIPANVFDEPNCLLEMDVNLDNVEPIYDGSDFKGVIFSVSYGEVRLLKDQSKVIWSGKVQVRDEPGWKTQKRKERAEREQLEWDRIKDSINPANFRAFLYAFPKGAHAEPAKNRLKDLASTEDQERAQPSLLWLDGLWEGPVDQGGNKWKIKLDARYSRYFFVYESRGCTGEWILIKKSAGKQLLRRRCIEKTVTVKTMRRLSSRKKTAHTSRFSI